MAINRIARVNRISPVRSIIREENVGSSDAYSLNPELPNYWFPNTIGYYFFKDTTANMYGASGNIMIWNESKYVKMKPPIPESKMKNDGSPTVVLPDTLVQEQRSKLPPINYHIFISDDGDKLRYLANHKTNGLPGAQDVIIYIEGDNDLLSQRFFAVKCGSQVVSARIMTRDIIQTYTTITESDLTNLLAMAPLGEHKLAGAMLDSLKYLTDGLSYALAMEGGALDVIMDKLDQLKVKRNVWNAAAQDGGNTILGEIKTITADSNELVNSIRQLADSIKNPMYKVCGQIAACVEFCADLLIALVRALEALTKGMVYFLSGFLAVFAGFVNGLIDTINGILLIVKLALSLFSTKVKLIGSVIGNAKKVINPSERQILLENFDNFIAQILNINPYEVVSSIYDKIVAFIDMVDMTRLEEILDKKEEELRKAIKDKLRNTKTSVNNAKQEATDYLTTDSKPVYDFCFAVGYLLAGMTTAEIGLLLKGGGTAAKGLGILITLEDTIFEKVFKIAGNTLRKLAANIGEQFAVLFRSLRPYFANTKAVKETLVKVFNAIIDWLDANLKGWRTIATMLTAFGLMSFDYIGANAFIELLAAGGFMRAVSIVTKFIKTFPFKIGKSLTPEGEEIFVILYKDVPIKTGTLKEIANYIEEALDDLENFKKQLDELAELARKRKEFFEKWASKFGDNFWNHILGDRGYIKLLDDGILLWKNPMKGYGGHWYNDFIEIVQILIPPNARTLDDIPFDTPYEVKLKIKTLMGVLCPKSAKSTMFPRNWSKERIMEEVAWVYEHTVAKGVEPDFINSSGHKFFDTLDSSGKFKIRIELKGERIINSYPKI